MRQLDERAAALDNREKEIERREKRLGNSRPMTNTEVARTAEAVEPKDAGWTAASTRPASLDPSMFRGAGRNDPCPCGSGIKFKRCHGGVDASE